MGLPVGTGAGVAIRLRILVREAIARGDDLEMCRLNRIADAAYRDLNAIEAGVYLAWCRDEMRPFIGVRGDA